MTFGPERRLRVEELMLFNCGAGEDSRVSWTTRSNQSILMGIGNNPEYSNEMLKLKLQFYDHMMQWTDSWKKLCYWERLKTRGEGGSWGWDDCMASPTQCTWTWANSGRYWRTGKPDVLKFMGSQSLKELLNEWTKTIRPNCSLGDLDISFLTLF